MSQIRYTAVAVFADAAQAIAAVHELREKGFSAEQIHQASGGADEGRVERPTAESDAVQGAGLGMLVGASLGGLAGSAPGMAAGGVVGGLLGAFLGLGVPEEEAHFYQGELHAGHSIVAVNAPARYDEAVDVLRKHGGRVDQSPLGDTGPGVLP